MKALIERIIKFLFNLFDKFVQKKEIVVFSCRGAKDYADNSKTLYEYFLNEGHENVYFFTKKKEILSKIPSNGIYAYSVKAFVILLRTKLFIFTHGIGDFYPYYPSGNSSSKFLNLFHAIAVKKVGSNNASFINQSKITSSFIVSSLFEKNYMMKLMHLNEDQINVLGHPRNDVLVNSDNKPKLYQKKILYAPTFRDSYKTELFPFRDKDLKSLDDLLAQYNISIAIRMHINDEAIYKREESISGYKNIFFEGSDIHPSVNEVLEQYQILLTDYSSIAVDYLLLDRPIAYIPYDYERYEKERGFAFDYYEHLAGPIIESQSELVTFILDQEDRFKTKRKAMENKFHQFKDGQSTQRLYYHAVELLTN